MLRNAEQCPRPLDRVERISAARIRVIELARAIATAMKYAVPSQRPCQPGLRPWLVSNASNDALLGRRDMRQLVYTSQQLNRNRG